MENKTVRAIIKHIDHRIDELKNNCYGMHQANKATAIRENNRILKFCQDLIKHKMETTNTPEIQIGDTVITRKFEDTKYVGWVPDHMDALIGKEGIVTDIFCDGEAIEVDHKTAAHRFNWPPSAVEPVTSNNQDTRALNNVISEMNKQWEPKPGEMVEYLDEVRSSKWIKAEFVHHRNGMNWIIDRNEEPVYRHLVTSSYIRPLQKSLREQISEILYGSSQANNKTLDRIMEVVEKVEGRKCNE